MIASGGVSSLDDLRAIAALVPLGVEGAIVGKALYAGRVHAGGGARGGGVQAPGPGAEDSFPKPAKRPRGRQ